MPRRSSTACWTARTSEARRRTGYPSRSPGEADDMAHAGVAHPRMPRRRSVAAAAGRRAEEGAALHHPARDLHIAPAAPRRRRSPRPPRCGSRRRQRPVRRKPPADRRPHQGSQTFHMQRPSFADDEWQRARPAPRHGQRRIGPILRRRRDPPRSFLKGSDQLGPQPHRQGRGQQDRRTIQRGMNPQQGHHKLRLAGVSDLMDLIDDPDLRRKPEKAQAGMTARCPPGR